MPNIVYVPDDIALDGLRHTVLILPAGDAGRCKVLTFREAGARVVEHAFSDLSEAVAAAAQIAYVHRSSRRGAYELRAFASLRGALETAKTRKPPRRKSRKAVSVSRLPRPDAETLAGDGEGYVHTALQPILDVWEWDDPDHRRAVSRNLNADQLALFAVWMVDGQIDNGGVGQALWNSPGELCEDAVVGLRRLGLTEQAGLLDEALSRLERPVPALRPDRQAMLARAVGLTERLDDLDLPDWQYVSELFKAVGARVSDLQSRWFRVKASGSPMLDVMAGFIDARWDGFFRT